MALLEVNEITSTTRHRALKGVSLSVEEVTSLR